MHERNFECPWYGVEQPRWTTMAVKKPPCFIFYVVVVGSDNWDFRQRKLCYDWSRLMSGSRLLISRQPPHYTGEIWNAALFVRLGLPSTIIRHENGAFCKRSSRQGILKTPSLRFIVDKKHFEKGAFRKRWRLDDHVISEFFLKHKLPVIVAPLNSSGVVWTDGFSVFSVQRETSGGFPNKFLWRV